VVMHNTFLSGCCVSYDGLSLGQILVARTGEC